MHIVISGAHRSAILSQPNDFKHFSVIVDSELRDSLASHMSRVAVRWDDRHGWISPSVIRSLSPLAMTAEWEAAFTAMVAFATQRGWTDQDGNLRAHIEYVTSDPGVDDQTFKRAMRKFASGVCVVACGSTPNRCGMTVSSFTSVSVTPPLVSVCINRSAFNHNLLVGNDLFSINILRQEQQDVAMTFAGATTLVGEDRFSMGAWQQHRETPVLTDALQTLVCRAELRQPLGTHTLLLGRVIHASDSMDAAPLVNFEGSMHRSLLACS